jgi:hypothetical protein
MVLIFAAAAAWCLFLGAAIVLGGVRDRLLAQRLGEETARRLLTLVLCAVIFLTTWGMAAVVGLGDPSAAWRIGAGWTLATLALETAMGRLVMKRSVAEILTDYKIWRGRLWLLVPVSTLSAPAVILAVTG